VRFKVLARAKGYCELCGQPGFLTAAGAAYLETHHIVPLSEDGPDTVYNVSALCPNDHRRAHHGQERGSIRDHLKSIVASKLSLAVDA
jgi:5-methylcytosine-specific restriction protein A